MRRIAQISVASIISIALVAGCANREVARVDPTQTKEQFKDIPVEINRNIDILFVVDNSGSMEEEQASLAANFYRFIDVLQNIEGGLPNVHIGVVSTDVGAGQFNIAGCSGNGDNGALQTGGACGLSGAYLSDQDDGAGGRITNYTGELADAFACVAELGITGCGFEQQFESMYRALNGSNPTNAGFLRDDAFLAVIFITDEDDCSTKDNGMFDTSQTTVDSQLGPLSSFRCFEFGVICEPDDPRVAGPRQNCRPRTSNDPRSNYMYEVSRYVEFLKGLKDDPNNIIVAGIIGNASPVIVGTDPETGNPDLAASCTSGSGEADPGVRLKAFLDQFPQRNTITTICEENLDGALVVIATLLAKVIGNPCLEGNIDMDPATEGVQYECQVSDVRFPYTDRQEEYPIANCDDVGGATPCWHLEINTETCGDTATKLELIIERGSAEVPTGTHVQARCVVQ